jgi:hypothetical protein
MVGSCEENNEPSGSIKGGEFIGQKSDNHFLKIVRKWTRFVIVAVFPLDQKARYLCGESQFCIKKQILIL